MHKFWGSLSPLALCFFATTLAASCGKIDTDKLEKAIADHFKTETGIAVDSVSCPKNREMKEGDSFECTAVAGGTKLVYTVTQKDGKGNVEWQLRDGVVVSSKLEKIIAEELTKQTKVAPKKITCGAERLRPSIPGSTFECLATAPDGVDWRVGITVTNAEGGVDFKVIGKAGAAPGGAPEAPGDAPAPPDDAPTVPGAE